MKYLLSILFLCSVAYGQTVPIDFTPIRPLIAQVVKDSARSVAAQVVRDSGAVVIARGTGARPVSVSQRGDTLTSKAIRSTVGLLVDETDSTVTIRQLWPVTTYSSSFTLGPNDMYVIYNGPAGSATFPPASQFPGRYVKVVNKAATTVTLSVNGTNLTGRRAIELVSNGTSWVIVNAYTILAGF